MPSHNPPESNLTSKPSQDTAPAPKTPQQKAGAAHEGADLVWLCPVCQAMWVVRSDETCDHDEAGFKSIGWIVDAK